MRLGNLIMLLVVGGSGLAAFILSYGYLGAQPDPNKGKIPVLATTQPVKRGDMLELGKNCEFKLVSETDIPEDAYKQDDKLVADLKARKMIATDNINRNATIVKNAASDSPNGLMEGMLKQYAGCQAKSISVSTDKVAAGFIKPNSRVDLYWTGRPDKGRETTTVFLSDVPVLAIDLENNAGTNTGGREVRYLTLAMKPQDCARLDFLTANGRGSISAALRQAGQLAGESATDVGWDTVFGKKKGATDDDKLEAADAEELESDGLRLMRTLDAVLQANAKPLPAANVAATPVAGLPHGKRGPAWLMFDLKAADGKVVTRVPMPADGEFVKKNRILLRDPEPAELETIAKLAAPTRGL